MKIPENILLYRMVHWQNVEYILRNGICCKEHSAADPEYINIGHVQLIADRHPHPVRMPGAGNLGEYIPFYFAGHSPMLYLIQYGYKGVERRPQEDIIFLVCPFDEIKKANLEYVFTDRNAKIAVAEFYNDEKDFDKIQWDIVKDKQWANDEKNMARQDFKQAEFLIRNFVPVNCITDIIVKSASRKAYFDELISKLNLEIDVLVDNKCKLFY